MRSWNLPESCLSIEAGMWMGCCGGTTFACCGAEALSRIQEGSALTSIRDEAEKPICPGAGVPVPCWSFVIHCGNICGSTRSFPAIGARGASDGVYVSCCIKAGDTGAEAVFIHSGSASGWTRLAALIFSCLFAGAPCCSCIQDGRDCSSINELADIAPIMKVLSVFGAGEAAGRCNGNEPAGLVSAASDCAGRSQPGRSSLFSLFPTGNDAGSGGDVCGPSPARSDSSHAGNSVCPCSCPWKSICGPLPPAYAPCTGIPHCGQFIKSAATDVPQRLHVITFVPHFRQARSLNTPTEHVSEVYHSLLGMANYAQGAPDTRDNAP